jgi:hypothetical protein
VIAETVQLLVCSMSCGRCCGNVQMLLSGLASGIRCAQFLFKSFTLRVTWNRHLYRIGPCFDPDPVLAAITTHKQKSIKPFIPN